MRVLRLHGVGDLRIHDESLPEPGPSEVLLRVTAVGICGSDLHWHNQGTTGDEGIRAPFVLGHEFAAIVEHGELQGKRVTVDPLIPCNACEYCREGNPNLCPNHVFAGQAPQDGALREYMAWPSERIFPLPGSLSDEDGAMLEPLGVALHTVDLGGIKPGMAVGVYGCGPIGLLVVQVARLAGAAQIIATDRLQHRIDAARETGATQTLLSRGGEENGEILAITQGRGLDVTFEVAGENDAVETAVDTCKPGGCVVLCGIPAANRVSFNASTARRKELIIKMVRRMKHTYPRAIRLVDNGQVDVRSLVTHRFSLNQYEEAFRVAETRSGIKVIIHQET